MILLFNHNQKTKFVGAFTTMNDAAIHVLKTSGITIANAPSPLEQYRALHDNGDLEVWEMMTDDEYTKNGMRSVPGYWLDGQFTLVVKSTSKSGKHHYQVIDRIGNVISERTSNRKYAACTINGRYFFGRPDLIGKGEHGQCLKHCVEHDTPIWVGLTVAELEPSFAKSFFA